MRPRDVPLGYRQLSGAPVHRGANYCRDCLCSPCIIQCPPDYLWGSCGPHPANAEKRHTLYRKFWRSLKALGVWHDEDYLRRKEARTVRDDRRDIMPDCVIEVHTLYPHTTTVYLLYFCLLQEIRRRYPSHDGEYRDYLSTFDASVQYDDDSMA